MINQIEWIRKQLYDLMDVLENKNDSEDILEQAGSLDDQFIDVEKNLFQMKLTGAGQDTFRWPAQLFVKFSSLAYEIMRPISSPPISKCELHEVLKTRLETHKASFHELIAKRSPRVQRHARSQGRASHY